MWRLSSQSILVCLACGFPWHGNAATVTTPHPEDGAVRNGVYTNEYFNLSYPLPRGWTEEKAGPGPSRTGYYVLSTLAPAGDLTGTLLIAAQDMFFAAKPAADAAAMADEFGRAMAKVEGMTIDRPPSEVRIGGRVFSRVDFSGVGLFRSTLITEIRCHLVSFNFIAKSPEVLAALTLSLSDLGLAGNGRGDPLCMSNYANTEHLLTKVDPLATGPTFAPIPVRIIVGTDGTVKQVHVISANGGQRDTIENALGRWKFKPVETNGRLEVETGLIVEFRPGGGVKYSTGKSLNPQGSK
jgi:hypothetical protein